MTKTHEEHRAQRNLEAQGFEVYGPMTQGSSQAVALFPGYVFIHMDAEDMSRYYRIRSTPGVFRVVCFNRIACSLYAQGQFAGPVEDLLPRPIHDGEALMAEIRLTVTLMNQPPEVTPQAFQAGDPVTVTGSLYEALNTKFARQMSGNRSLVLIQYLEKRRDPDNVVRERVKTEHKVVVETRCLKSANEPKPVRVKSMDQESGERQCEICTRPLKGRASRGYDKEDHLVRVGRCCQGQLKRLLDRNNPEDRALWQQTQKAVKSE